MVAGDLVNTASRLQSVGAARHGAGRRSDERRGRGGDRVRGRRRARAQGQGRAPCSLWRALRVVGGTSRRRAAPPRSSRRSSAATRELRLLKELFHATGRATAIRTSSRSSGVAGIGKTRLAWEFEKYIDGLVDEPSAGTAAAASPTARGSRTGRSQRWSADARRHRRGRRSATPRARSSHAVARGDRPRPEHERRFVEPRLAAPARAEHGAARRSRRSCSAAWRLFFERMAEHAPGDPRLRGHAVGRRGTARVPRVPARMVAQPSRSS